MILLRPEDQQPAVEKIREHLRAGRRSVLFQAPTGFGKTVVMAYMAARAVERGKRVLFNVHRDYLMDQISDTLSRFGVEHGFIGSWHKITAHPVQIASSLSLVRRFDAYPDFDLVVFDEAHRTLSKTNLTIAKRYPNAHLVGLTATPQRLDGKALGDVYDALVLGPSMNELIARGSLCPYKYFAPSTVDMTGVKKTARDFDVRQTEERVIRPSIIGNAINHYRTLAPGSRAIAFCVSRNHSRATCDAFKAAGVPAAHIDGETTSKDRSEILKRFALGDLKVLTNVELISEGFDVPGVETVIQLRPTQSVILYLQSVGRALRKAEGKTHATILDHVGNCHRHGLPADPRDWSLAGREKRERTKVDELTIAVRQCENCYAVFKPAPACPQCGMASKPSPRELKVREGELKEIEKIERREMRREEGQAKTYEELQKIARARGYSDGWAWHRWRARQSRMGGK